MLSRIGALYRKLTGHLDLLRRDPERFGRNLMQATHKQLHESRLLDVADIPPMHVAYAATSDRPPSLTVLDTAWNRTGMTGGPNSVVNLAARVARLGIPVRLVSTSHPATIDPAWLRQHVAALLGTDELPEIEIASAADPARPLPLGPRDVFLATHWITAQQLKAVLPRLPVQKFFFMLQEFEPGFYPWSSNYALAVETYGLDFWPIINEASLADYLFSQGLGRFGDPDLRHESLIFEPAIDSRVFHARTEGRPASRRLLFYARPTNFRNMFGLGMAALRMVATDPAFAGWEFMSIGARGSVPELKLGGSMVLRQAPWLGYEGYADLLRSADLLLCPMLSPHTSYPVLEMVACGGVAVTNTFATKTRAVLEALSPDIVVAEPTPEALAGALLTAARDVNAGRQRLDRLRGPRDWSSSLDPVARRVADLVLSATGWI